MPQSVTPAVPRRPIASIAVAVALALAAPTAATVAGAGNAADVAAGTGQPADADRAVAGLDAPTWAERRTAARRCREVLDEDEVVERLRSADLPAEARHRLFDLLRRQLLERPRGALGINLNYYPPRGGRPGYVLVRSVHPGLPAEQVLRADDRLLAVDGEPLDREGSLAALVQRRRPGDTVRLTVQRPRRDPDGHLLRDEDDNEVLEDRIEVDIRLTSVERLPGNGLGGRPDREAREQAREEWEDLRDGVSPAPHRVRFEGDVPSWIIVR